jgi:hypothetical protein
MNRSLSRRAVLRGAGVALALPWMESLQPKSALAQAEVRKRYLPIFLPNGAAEAWTPVGQGVGAAWKLSGVLDPLLPFKAKTTILTNLENGTSFNANGGSSVEPSHGRQPGAWLTCQDPAVARMALGLAEANIPSIDQRIAKFLGSVTPIPSLQVGLSTTESFCDGQPCSNSRTVSWGENNLPMYKLVDPLEVFNKMVGFAMPTMPGMTPMPDPELQKRLAMNKSVLDAVINNANATKAKLGRLDQQRLSDFLDSVRAVEIKATMASSGMGGLACTPIAAPTISTMANPIHTENFARQNSETYNKGTHADVMNELIVMAFQCDATRVITYMLEDERSEFAYDHVTRRTFSAESSTEASGTCGEYHNGGQHGNQDDFATITWWNVGKVAALCQKLDMLTEENGKTVLDNTFILFGGAMHGSNHACNELPMALIGSGGGTFKTDQHVEFTRRWLRDLHHTVMTRMYGMTGADVESFGADRADVPRSEISEILV